MKVVICSSINVILFAIALSNILELILIGICSSIIVYLFVIALSGIIPPWTHFTCYVLFEPILIFCL